MLFVLCHHHALFLATNPNVAGNAIPARPCPESYWSALDPFWPRAMEGAMWTMGFAGVVLENTCTALRGDRSFSAMPYYETSNVPQARQALPCHNQNLAPNTVFCPHHPALDTRRQRVLQYTHTVLLYLSYTTRSSRRWQAKSCQPAIRE